LQHLRDKNPNYSNYDIREIVTKDCIEIWQRATIMDALPEEYKEKAKQAAAEASHAMKKLSTWCLEITTIISVANKRIPT
jgi:hypothetical protein